MSQLFCGKCGTKFSNDDKFCKKCGNKRKFSQQNATTPAVKQDFVKPHIPEKKPTVATPSPKKEPATVTNIPAKGNTDKNNAPTTKKVKQAVPQSQKKLLTDKIIKSKIGAGGTFILSIVLLGLGILCFAGAGSIDPRIGIIGFFLCVGFIIQLVSSFKKTRYKSNYTVVLRKCIRKTEVEGETTSYYMIFDGFMDSWNDLAAEVKSITEYNAIEVGDLYYVVASKNKNSEEYSVAAYFKESEWRLE